jgi:hypothetical protein
MKHKNYCRIYILDQDLINDSKDVEFGVFIQIEYYIKY